MELLQVSNLYPDVSSIRLQPVKLKDRLLKSIVLAMIMQKT